MKTNIAVIGAGVIGLMTAIRLLEKGLPVKIFCREQEPFISSRCAPAIWIPYKALPEDKVLRWAEQSLNIYRNMLQDTSETELGVTLTPLVEYHLTKDLPLWTNILKDYTTFTNNLPTKSIIGYTSATYVIDSNVFMNYLMKQYKELGGKIAFANFHSLTDVPTEFNVIVNCSGVWSHQLVPDKSSTPIRGQYVLTEKPKNIDKIIFSMKDENSYTLIVPRIHDCYIGGTVETDNWNTDVNDTLTKSLIQDASTFFPELTTAPIKKVGVGLRPGRSSVRVEKTNLDDGRTLIHNYGHGGSGFTIGWGCAAEVCGFF